MYTLFVILLASASEYTVGVSVESKYPAIVNITYTNPDGVLQSKVKEMGFFAYDGRREAESGVVVIVRTLNNSLYACSDIRQPPITTKWIALIKRGMCNFTTKIINAAKKGNASAVVMYSTTDPEPKPNTHMSYRGNVKDVVTIVIGKKDGEEIAQLVDNGSKVMMYIRVGTAQPATSTNQPHYSAHNISKTSVLFVSISFIVLMIISLAWLVFYYIQRFRYAHAKERLSRRLASAAKKAIAKIPQRTVRSGDKELESENDQCPVCIEPYKTSDVIRILPCKHVFHKSCVDPWLLDQRSCPMCKLDILRAYGMHLNGSQDSVHPDPESTVVAASGGTEEAEPSPMPEESGLIQVKINLYECPSVHYRHTSNGESSQETELLNSKPAVPGAMNLEDSMFFNDSECDEGDSLMTGMPLKT